MTRNSAVAQQYRNERCRACGTVRQVLNGTWLRQRMAEKQITFKALADASGLSPQYINDVALNRRGLSAEALSRVLRALDDPRTAAARKRKYAPRGIPE